MCCFRCFALACRLHLYLCRQEHVQVAVGMLAQLSQLITVAFGVHSCWASELHDYYPDLDEWEHFLQPPPLGGVAALSELWLAGRVALPPDFRQLSHLRRLTVAGAYSDEGGPFHWETESLAGLASLTCVTLEPNVYAHSPARALDESREPGIASACLLLRPMQSHCHAATASIDPCRPGCAGLGAPAGRGACAMLSRPLAGSAGGAAP